MKSIAVLAFAVLLIAPPGLSAQSTGTITGIVTGTGARPVAAASVNVVGTTQTTRTDPQGRYTLTGVAAGSRTIRASFAGYAEATRAATVAAGQTATLNIQLTAQAVQLEEVVAIGYGTARRRDVAGAVASVKPEEGAVNVRQPSSAMAGALQGKAPGVQVISNSGAPGSGVTVRVRGSNSIVANAEPLYVIDGLPITQGSNAAGTNPLASLDPSSIESMEILKDASQTAIYGARGANGVILITTKRGTRGQNTVSFETSYGVQKISRNIAVLNAPQFMQLTNEANITAGRAATYTQANIDTAQTYDYLGAILRSAPQSSQQLTVSGGDERTRYLVAGSYASQDGIILNTTFNRSGVRLNLDRTVSSKLRVGSSVSGTYVLQHQPVGDGAIRTALIYLPNVAFRDAQGNWIRDLSAFGIQGTGNNPYADASETIDDRNQWRAIGNLYGEYDLMKSLTLRSTFGGNFSFARNGSYSPRTITGGFTANGLASVNQQTARELTNENTLQWRGEMGPGQLDVLVGATIQKARTLNNNMSGQNFPSDEYGYNALNLSGATNRTITSDRVEWALLSQLARVNYNLLDRYIFTFTGRRDGSSRFGANHKWAVFPSAAFAWHVLDEPFMQDQSLFSDLKFRVSYGKTGNQAISEYQSLNQLQTQFWSFGTSAAEQPAISPTSTAGNPDLKWETQSQFNTGIDFAFFDNRLAVTADAYQSKTTDLLFNVDLPAQEGFTTQLQNVGSVQNRGVEAGINTNNWEGDFFSWRTSLNVSRNRNKVLALTNGVNEFLPSRTYQGLDGGSANIVRVGEPLGSFYGWKSNGLYQAGDACALKAVTDCTPGEIKYIDTNGDQVIDASDRVILGNGDPDFYGGFTSNMAFGPVTLDAFFNFSYGNELANIALAYNGMSRALANERADFALNRWTPTNTNTNIPRANNARVGRMDDRVVNDASFLRLQTLTLGYRLPSRLIPGTSATRLYLSGQNLWLTTKYNGFDPEASTLGGTSIERGIDNGAYPRARSWNVGANVTF
jgi:TonB-linked SusC/RagA family outer membrane protein